MQNGGALSFAKRVLVVEDDPYVSETLSRLLRSLGHTVEFAINGYAALRIAPDFVPDVVVLDLGLPDVDGCLLAKQFRRMPALKNVRIVVVSGRGRPGDHARALSAGCDEYFLKPVDPVLLESII